MSMNNSPFEHDEQCAFFYRVSIHYPWLVNAKLFFAIPNGGFRNKATARKLQKEGLVAGIPDMFLAYPKGGYHGLFIEMKRQKGGHLEPAQKVAIANLKEAGYRVEVAKGCEKAFDILKQYLQGQFVRDKE